MSLSKSMTPLVRRVVAVGIVLTATHFVYQAANHMDWFAAFERTYFGWMGLLGVLLYGPLKPVDGELTEGAK